MPYNESLGGDERANPLGHVSLISDLDLARKLGEIEPTPISASHRKTIDKIAVREDELPEPDGPPVEEVIAIDGSRAEPAVGSQNHPIRVGFIEVSLVHIDLTELRAQRQKRFVDPVVMDRIASAESARLLMPSTNALWNGETTHESWRTKTYENFHETDLHGTSLWETYHELLGRTPRFTESGLQLKRCPDPECDARDILISDIDPDTCPQCGVTTYPTDYLRIHERVAEGTENLTGINILMNVVEQLALATALRYHAKEPERLEKMCFLKDGPLAQFDTSAWLHEPLWKVINKIRQTQCSAGFATPVIVGIAKSKEFAQYAHRVRDELFPREVLPLSNQHIYTHIKPGRDRNKMFGKKTYYGKNFVIKSGSAASQVFAVTIPRRYKGGGFKTGNLLHEAKYYPELRRVVDVLTESKTILYDDALVPISLAHGEASIPENLGEKVLERLVEENLKWPGDGGT